MICLVRSIAGLCTSLVVWLTEQRTKSLGICAVFEKIAFVANDDNGYWGIFSAGDPIAERVGL